VRAKFFLLFAVAGSALAIFSCIYHVLDATGFIVVSICDLVLQRTTLVVGVPIEEAAPLTPNAAEAHLLWNEKADSLSACGNKAINHKV
jgi:hypothetical protein